MSQGYSAPVQSYPPQGYFEPPPGPSQSSSMSPEYQPSPSSLQQQQQQQLINGVHVTGNTPVNVTYHQGGFTIHVPTQQVQRGQQTTTSVSAQLPFAFDNPPPAPSSAGFYGYPHQQLNVRRSFRHVFSRCVFVFSHPRDFNVHAQYIQHAQSDQHTTRWVGVHLVLSFGNRKGARMKSSHCREQNLL